MPQLQQATPVLTSKFTVRLCLVMTDLSATITRHGIAATSEDQAVIKAKGLAEIETGRHGWELAEPHGVEPDDD